MILFLKQIIFFIFKMQTGMFSTLYDLLNELCILFFKIHYSGSLLYKIFKKKEIIFSLDLKQKGILYPCRSTFEKNIAALLKYFDLLEHTEMFVKGY